MFSVSGRSFGIAIEIAGATAAVLLFRCFSNVDGPVKLRLVVRRVEYWLWNLEVAHLFGLFQTLHDQQFVAAIVDHFDGHLGIFTCLEWSARRTGQMFPHRLFEFSLER